MDKQYAKGLVVSVVGGVLLSLAIFWIVGAFVAGWAMGRSVGETRRKAIIGGVLVGLIVGIFVSATLYSTYTTPAWEPSYPWLYTSGSLDKTLAIETALLTGVIGSLILSVIGSFIGQRSFPVNQQQKQEQAMQAIRVVKNIGWIYWFMIGFGLFAVYMGVTQLMAIQNGSFVSRAGPELYYGLVAIGILMIIGGFVLPKWQKKALEKAEEKIKSQGP